MTDATDGTLAPYGAAFTTQELVLTWKRFTAMQVVPDCVRDVRLEVVRNIETATGYAHFAAPATWWQHVKHQHGHRWWLRPLVRRRPVRMSAEVRRVTLTATWENMAAYPWAELAAIAPRDRLGAAARLSWLTSTMDWTGGSAP